MRLATVQLLGNFLGELATPVIFRAASSHTTNEPVAPSCVTDQLCPR